MSLIYADRVKETTTTTGTGTLSLAGAELGHQGIVAAIGDGNSGCFCAEDGTDWEVFEGTVTDAAPDTLTRDTILASSNAGSAVDWSAGTKNVFLVVPASKITDFDTRLKVISADLTLYVATTGNDTTGDGSSGSPWATPHKALAYLKGYWINSDVTVTIECADGTYTFTEAIEPVHPCGDRILIKGENIHTKSMTSVQSSSGGAGAWSVIINLNSVTDIAVDDFALIYLPSGGTKPTYIAGCHKVTNVDGVNNRITISSAHQSATAPSGAIAATVTILKTIFKNNTTQIVKVRGRCGKMSQVALDGNGSSYPGIDVNWSGFLITEVLGISGTYGGLSLENNGLVEMLTPTCVSKVTNHAYLCDDSSHLEALSAVASGITAGGCYGFFCGYGSVIKCNDSISTGGASVGFGVTLGGRMRVGNCVATAHTSGFYGSRYGYMYAPGAAGSDNTADFSPAVNTQGNDFGYIDT